MNGHTCNYKRRPEQWFNFADCNFHQPFGFALMVNENCLDFFLQLMLTSDQI